MVAVAIYYVFAYASVYLFPGSPEGARHRTHTGLLLPHIVGGIVALLLGPVPFVPTIRNRHRRYTDSSARPIWSVLSPASCAGRSRS